MNYSEKANEINSYISEIETSINTLSNTSIGSVWSGEIATQELEQLNNYITSLEHEIAKIKQLAESLKLLQSYKENDENIESLKNTLSGITDSEENTKLIADIKQKISSLERTNSELKTSINSIDNISPISQTNKKVTYVVPELNISLDVA